MRSIFGQTVTELLVPLYGEFILDVDGRSRLIASLKGLLLLDISVRDEVAGSSFLRSGRCDLLIS